MSKIFTFQETLGYCHSPNSTSTVVFFDTKNVFSNHANPQTTTTCSQVLQITDQRKHNMNINSNNNHDNINNNSSINNNNNTTLAKQAQMCAYWLRRSTPFVHIGYLLI